MSIFLEITREFLIKSLEAIKARLETNDNGYMGALRNKELSEAKKKLATELITYLRELPLNRDDAGIKTLICEEITRIKTKGFSKSHEHGQGEGQFGKECGDVFTLVGHIYSKFEICGLLGVQKSADPFSLLCYHSGYYLAQKAYEPLEEGFVSYAAHHPNVSNLWRLRNAKEEIIKTQIQMCREALLALDKTQAKYAQNYRQRVLDYVDAVMRDNERKCSEHKTQFGMPILSFGLFSMLSASSSIAPKPGFLDTCMRRVRRDIEDALALLNQQSSTSSHATIPALLSGAVIAAGVKESESSSALAQQDSVSEPLALDALELVVLELSEAAVEDAGAAATSPAVAGMFAAAVPATPLSQGQPKKNKKFKG